MDDLRSTNVSYSTPLAGITPTLRPTDYWSFGSYPDPDGIKALRLSLYGVVIPFVSVIGILANFLNIVVLSRLVKLKQASIYDILLAMAVADLCICGSYLVNSALLFMRADPILGARQPDQNTLGSAAYIIYLSVDPIANVSGFISNWCTVVMAAFRFIAVYFPLHASQWCTRHRARIAVVAVTVTTLVVTLPSRLMLIARNAGFDSVPAQHLDAYVSIVHPVINDLVPWLLCVILMSLLLVSLRRKTIAVDASHGRKNRTRKHHSKLTVLLVCTAAWFVATTAPSTASIILSSAGDPVLSRSASFTRLFLAGQVLVLMNFTGNFFFYSCMNKKYRQQLRELLPAHILPQWSKWSQWKSKKLYSSSSSTYVRPACTAETQA